MSYAILAMFTVHLFNISLITALADFWVMRSFTSLDILNNSLSILVLNSLHTMGSKIFIKFLHGDHAATICGAEYLQTHINEYDYQNV